MARYPEVRVALQLSDRMVDEGFDVAIRTGALDDSSLTVKPLAPYRLMICATPDYLAQHAPIESPYDLLAHDLIVFGKTNLAYEWIFMRDKEKICLPISGRLTINDNTAQLNVVLAGGGIILQSADLLQPYVARGLLVPILTDYQLPSRVVNGCTPAAV